MDGVIRPVKSFGKPRFASADDVPAKGVRDIRHEGLERGAQLVFGGAEGELPHLDCHGVAKFTKRLEDRCAHMTCFE